MRETADLRPGERRGSRHTQTHGRNQKDGSPEMKRDKDPGTGAWRENKKYRDPKRDTDVKRTERPGAVAHTCNPSTLGG